MKKIILQSENKRDVTLIKDIDPRFHGKITIHFANGVPKKVEINQVEDVSIPV